MFQPCGLYGHIRNNNAKSVALLATFALYVALLWFVCCLLWAGLTSKFQPIILKLGNHQPTVTDLWQLILARTIDCALHYAFVPMAVLLVWFAVAFVYHKTLIRSGTGARPIVRSLEYDLYNVVENLAIAAGLPMPAVEIIESDALNAYASGLGATDATIAVTRGLLQTLSKDELEAVLAHELSHIRNRDVRLMEVAIIFVGILTYVAQMLWQAVWNRRPSQSLGMAELALFAVATGLACVAQLFGVLTQFALSRTREFLADAGAVELTKKPEALVSALRKISGRDEIPGLPQSLRAMMISSRLEGLFATHPPIEARIAALEAYAGASVALVSRRAGNSARAPVQSAPAMQMPGFGFAPPAQPQIAFGRRKARPLAHAADAL